MEKTFKNLLQGKVWKAVQAMIDGLQKQSKRDGFVVDMNYWGHSEGNLCYGCAATSTVQEVCGIDYSVNDLPLKHKAYSYSDGTWYATQPKQYETFKRQAKTLRVCDVDVFEFETAVDALRRGHPYALFQYMGVTGAGEIIDELLPALESSPFVGGDNSDWLGKLKYYQDYANKLKALDI